MIDGFVIRFYHRSRRRCNRVLAQARYGRRIHDRVLLLDSVAT